MLQASDQPTMRDILHGWYVVRTGNAQIGDRFWRADLRAWIPLTSNAANHDIPVTAKDMPVVIRKERK